MDIPKPQPTEQPRQDVKSRFQELLTKVDKLPRQTIPNTAGATVEEQIFMGVPVPARLRSFFWSFDRELSTTKLDNYGIEYLVASFNEISAWAQLFNILKGDSKVAGMIRQEIDNINIEVKAIVRGYRAHEGFTMIVGRSQFYDYGIREEKELEKKEGAVSKLAKWRVQL